MNFGAHRRAGGSYCLRTEYNDMRSILQFSRSPLIARPNLKRRPMSLLILTALCASAHGAELPAEDIAEFEPNFFNGSAITQADLSRFSRPNAIMPGIYRTELRVNGERQRTEEVRFVQAADGVTTHPCLSDSLLRSIGLSADLAPAGEPGVAQADACKAVETRHAGLKASFDVADQSLDITIPQGYLERRPRGYVDPALWDYGVNAGMLGYRFNSYASQSNGYNNRTSYLALDAGLNIGKWRLRQSSSLSFGTAGSHYSAIRAYAQRDVPSLNSQLALGDTYTDGRQMDSFRIRGISLSSDERMSPSSQGGYAPTVQGVAETNARVVISQRGTQLYQMTVAPGPFVIDDLYATGYGGDLLVEIHEADGRVRSFTVPFSATPNILREGQSRYSVTTGQFNEEQSGDKPWVTQATYARGLTNMMTGYMGAAFANGYSALQLGTAYNTRIGAVSFDVTGARATLSDQGKRSGHSVQLRYSKNFAKQGTTFALGAYRYSTQGFLGLADTMRLRDAIEAGYGMDTFDRIRSRFDVTLNQSIGPRGGAIYANASAQSYWNARRDTKSFSLGYSNSIGPLTLGLNAQRSMVASLDGHSSRDTTYQLSVSMPLGKEVRAPVMSASIGHADARGTDGRLGINGTLGEDGLLRYGASASVANGNGSQLNGSLDYRAPSAELSIGASRGSGYHTASVGASGGIVVHPKGVTFAQSLGDTIAVVEAQGAQGARISNATGVKIGKGGFAVVPYLSPYVKNAVNLNPVGASLDVEFGETSQSVVPTLGSVLLLDYASKAGTATLIEATDSNGAPLPFGADVMNTDGTLVGAVGQASMIFLNRADGDSEYVVRWGELVAQQCLMKLPEKVQREKGEAFTRLRVSCTRHADVANSATAMATVP